MASTRIVIEVESEDGAFISAISAVVPDTVRELLAECNRRIPKAKGKFSITHDGKDVTEVIQ